MSTPLSTEDARRYGIFRLTEADRPALIAHLLSLDSEGRRRRFGLALRDESIVEIASKLPLDTQCLGLFVWGELKGCVQVLGEPGGSRQELAVSLSPEMRGRGWGKELVQLALSRAKDRRVEQVDIQYLAENAAMHRIAGAYPGRSQVWSGEIVRSVRLQDCDLF